ncbi:MAG: hydantoinase/oxoprolinase family protein, partial [Gemmatimonadota bacterium]
SRALGASLGHQRILSIDVGGTSFDVGVIIDGEPLMRSGLTLAGTDIRHPTIDVATIGAGGGSIAEAEHGALRVGPQSAGAEPGPACYGRGGTRPTVTDADLLLGVLAPEDFHSGGIELDVAAAEKAVRTHIAEPLGLDVRRAAWGIRRVLDSRMADLLRSVTIERGHDPREFVMYANGGQGPARAWALAREIGIRTVVIAPMATVQSALGTATTVRRRTSERSVHIRLSDGTAISGTSVDLLAATATELIHTVVEALGSERDELELDLSAAVRYRGQAHHLDVPLAGVPGEAGHIAELLGRFERDYEALFGRGAAFPEAGYEVLSVRATGTLPLPMIAEPQPADDLTPAGDRQIVFDDPDSARTATVYHAELPRAGQRIVGPAIVVFPGQTAVVPPGATAETDRRGNLILDLGPPAPTESADG